MLLSDITGKYLIQALDGHSLDSLYFHSGLSLWMSLMRTCQDDTSKTKGIPVSFSCVLCRVQFRKCYQAHMLY